MKNLALHWKIIIGMILGVAYGLIANQMGWVSFTNDWIKPWGTIFVNLLKLIAVPLVFASLIKGVASLSDISRLSRIGGKTIAFYLASTVIAVTIGLFLVNSVQPGNTFSEEKRMELKETYASKVGAKINAATNVKEEGPLQFVVDMVPSNFMAASSNNRNMLQVIFFAILFGIAMIMLPKEKTTYVKGFFDGVNDIILQIVDIIMLMAPYGVFALLGGLVVDFGGSADLFIALGMYSITVIVGLLLMILLIYPIILKTFTKVKYVDFSKQSLLHRCWLFLQVPQLQLYR